MLLGTKQKYWSDILGREFHFDFFEPSVKPSFMVIMLGGSGISEEEYAKRSQSVIPVFDKEFTQLSPDFSFIFVYVTAPYDVRINDLNNDEDEAERWERHVSRELLRHLPNLPFYFIGYSGGLVLALHCLANHSRCFGGGALGGDLIPRDLAENFTCDESLALYYNLQDRVFELNREAIEILMDEEIIQFYRKLPGGHNLLDYIQNGSFGGLVRRANRLLREEE